MRIGRHSCPVARDSLYDFSIGTRLAASLGGFDDVAAGARAVAAPTLAYVRGGEVLPALVSQPSIDDKPQLDGEELAVGPTWVHDRIAAGVATIMAGRFDAMECDACRFCAFAASCPARGPRTGAQR